jgi:hypothetical protein
VVNQLEAAIQWEFLSVCWGLKDCLCDSRKLGKAVFGGCVVKDHVHFFKRTLSNIMSVDSKRNVERKLQAVALTNTGSYTLVRDISNSKWLKSSF